MSIYGLLSVTALTDEMVKRRDDLKRIYGDSYAERTAVPRRAVKALAEKHGKSTGSAPLRSAPYVYYVDAVLFASCLLLRTGMDCRGEDPRPQESETMR